MILVHAVAGGMPERDVKAAHMAFADGEASAAEVIRIESCSPAGFGELLAAQSALPREEVRAWLHLPDERSAGRLPLVILSIGSLGVASGREALYAAALGAAGIAVLVVDSFGSRGFAETASDQGRVSFATSCADSLHALRQLGADPRFDPARIGLFGYSRGGNATLLCDDERLIAAVAGPGRRFAAFAAFYPSTWLQWRAPRPLAAPCLVVIAGNDDLALPHLVRARADALRAAGAGVEVVTIPDLFHSFDSLAPASFRPDETNMCECEVMIEDDGAMVERVSGVRFDGDWPDFVRRLRDARGTRGGTTGIGPAPRDVAVPFAVDFFRGALA